MIRWNAASKVDASIQNWRRSVATKKTWQRDQIQIFTTGTQDD